jgi:GNAT superfamily N-acetyltransferase
VAALHQEHYRTVEDFDETFDKAVEAALSDLLSRSAPDRSRGLVLEMLGHPRGCLFLFDEAAERARIRLFLVGPELRGQGVGRRMLKHAITQARSIGMATLVVSTFDRHAAACAIYRRAGFRETGRAEVQAFGHDLLKLDFRLDLDDAATDEER